MKLNYQIKTKLERSEKRKPTNTCRYWKLVPSNKRRWKKIKKEYFRTRKLLETKLYTRNLIKEINTWSVSLVRYSRPFLKLTFMKWTREELKLIDQKTRKLITMDKALHPRDNVERLHVPRKEGERGLDNTT